MLPLIVGSGFELKPGNFRSCCLLPLDLLTRAGLPGRPRAAQPRGISVILSPQGWQETETGPSPLRRVSPRTQGIV